MNLTIMYCKLLGHCQIIVMSPSLIWEIVRGERDDYRPGVIEFFLMLTCVQSIGNEIAEYDG